MNDESSTVSVEFVAVESSVPDYVAEVEKSGGTLHGNPKPYQIPPEQLDDYSDAQFEPLMVVAVAVSVGFLIKRISDVWLDHKRPGGQVIDAQGDKIVVRYAPYLERGTLVVERKDGVKVFKTKQKDEAIDLLKEVVTSHG